MLSNKKNKKKFVIIIGPTASGKTTLAIQLASLIRGEIISADSRQIYRGMDIGTGKDLSEYDSGKIKIKHHLIDILDPNENYSVYDFQKDFLSSYNKIVNNNNIPILCGGTGLYVESILLNYDLSDKPPPDNELRNRLNGKSKTDLLVILHKKIGNVDKSNLLLETNKQIIRQIEILSSDKNKDGFSFIPLVDNAIIFGINIERDILRSRIKDRLIQRVEEGLVFEVEELISSGLPMERLDYFGLEYKYVGRFLRGEVSKKVMIEELTTSIRRFAKRQRTWFRRMEKRGIKINWINNTDIDFMLQLISKN